MSNIIDKIRISGVTYTLQGSGGGGGTVDSAITSGSTNAVESKAIYNATHVEQVDLWTPTDNSSYRDTSQSLYKVYVQYTGDTALDEQVQVEIYYGSSSTVETLSGNVYQETATTSSVFTSAFDNGKWIIESSSPNYIVNIYSDYRFRIWTYDRTVGGDFAADVIKDDIIPYIGDVETVANNAIVSGGFQGYNNREIAIRLQRGNGGSVSSSLRLDDLKYTQDVLSTDIQIPTGEVGWTEITPQNYCTAGNMPTNKVKVTYSGQTVSASYRGLRFDAVLRYSNGNRYYTAKIYWSDTTTPMVDDCSAVTATYDSTDDSVIIELPTGETTYDGLTGTFSISNFRSNSCQFGTGISSVKYYGDITEDIYTAIAHKQDTLSAGTGISISGNVISATGGGGGTVSSAITSGDTNAVAGGAVYDKFDEVEQVTARALNDLDEKINPTVELTQAQYDALVSAGTVSADTYYIISDATAFDPTTKVDTSAFTAYSAATNTALNNKVDTSAITSSVTSASTDSQIPTAKAVWEAASGGGTTYTAGRGISIANDTISVSLPISAGTGSNSIIIGESTNISNSRRSIATGYKTKAQQSNAFAQGYQTEAGQEQSHAEGYQTKAYGVNSHSEGRGTSAMTTGSHAEGFKTIANNDYEHSQGWYNVSSKANNTFGDSGNTLFSVGNGTSTSARHNAFEIRQNGDIYLTKDGQDVKLQDQLGGSSITVDTALDSGSTNPVENRVIYNKIDEVEQVTAAGLNALNDNFGGLKLVKLTQTEYNALATKDASTLYIIVN